MQMKYCNKVEKNKRIERKNRKKVDTLLRFIKQLMPQEPRSYDISDDPGFWQKGDKILCPSNIECEVVAEFFRDMLTEFDCMEVVTGQDAETGFFLLNSNDSFYVGNGGI